MPFTQNRRITSALAMAAELGRGLVNCSKIKIKPLATFHFTDMPGRSVRRVWSEQMRYFYGLWANLGVVSQRMGSERCV